MAVGRSRWCSRVRALLSSLVTDVLGLNSKASGRSRVVIVVTVVRGQVAIATEMLSDHATKPPIRSQSRRVDVSIGVLIRLWRQTLRWHRAGDLRVYLQNMFFGRVARSHSGMLKNGRRGTSRYWQVVEATGSLSGASSSGSHRRGLIIAGVVRSKEGNASLLIRRLLLGDIRCRLMLRSIGCGLHSVRSSLEHRDTCRGLTCLSGGCG